MHLWRYADLVAEIRPVSILCLRCHMHDVDVQHVAMPMNVSILCLRCIESMFQTSVETCRSSSFNSLFEMPERGRLRRGVHKGRFNSLFEMLLPENLLGALIGRGFNSLFEMPWELADMIHLELLKSFNSLFEML